MHLMVETMDQHPQAQFKEMGVMALAAVAAVVAAVAAKGLLVEQQCPKPPKQIFPDKNSMYAEATEKSLLIIVSKQPRSMKRIRHFAAATTVLTCFGSAKNTAAAPNTSPAAIRLRSTRRPLPRP